MGREYRRDPTSTAPLSGCLAISLETKTRCCWKAVSAPHNALVYISEHERWATKHAQWAPTVHVDTQNKLQMTRRQAYVINYHLSAPSTLTQGNLHYLQSIYLHETFAVLWLQIMAFSYESVFIYIIISNVINPGCLKKPTASKPKTSKAARKIAFALKMQCERLL